MFKMDPHLLEVLYPFFLYWPVSNELWTFVKYRVDILYPFYHLL